MSTRSTQHRAAQRRRSAGELLRQFVLAAALLTLAQPMEKASGADAPAFVLIVHPDTDLTATTRDFVAQAFLRRVTRWDDGDAIRPVDLPADSRTRRDFSRDVLSRSVDAMRSYWQQRIFSGRELPPPELASDEAVIRYVMSTKGAIGYVSPQTKLEKAKVLTVH